MVQNYAYSVKGFARDLDQPALRKRVNGVFYGLESLLVSGNTAYADSQEKVRLTGAWSWRDLFYWEGYGDDI